MYVESKVPTFPVPDYTFPPRRDPSKTPVGGTNLSRGKCLSKDDVTRFTNVGLRLKIVCSSPTDIGLVGTGPVTRDTCLEVVSVLSTN